MAEKRPDTSSLATRIKTGKRNNAGLSQSRRVGKRIMSGVPGFLRRKGRQVCLQKMMGRGVTGGLRGTRGPTGIAAGSEAGTQEGIH